MHITTAFEPTRSAAAEARAAVRPLREALPSGRFDDLELVVSELVTNGVIHGPGKPIRLSVELLPGGVVRGEVVDEGSRSGEVRVRTPVAGVPGGHGLRMVDAVCRRWGVSAGSTHVWFELGPED